MASLRPNPDKLLQQVQNEEHQQERGKLRIYLGAAPGVGKTHEMLHDALAERAKGLDVVVGVAESHGRVEIETILKELEVLPRQEIEYHGKLFYEFDLNAAVNRHPGLVLIDEMAHTNVPGIRHKKRWQDIKELLDRGIDVYTTLNVQHIESLNDDVALIIHAPIKETVPDSMIEMADTIELVDLPPEELLNRLHEGKIYIPAQATIAAENYFRKGNLIALRELALRVTAERVGAQVLLYRQGQGIRHIWPTRDKILVCVGAGPESLKLIRTAKRMANNLQAEWLAVYIDSPRIKNAEESRNHAIQNLRMAEQLGAQTRVLTGFDIVTEVLNFARDQNVTQIMIWKHIRKRWWNPWTRGIADEIVRHSGEIDVYVMTGTREYSSNHEVQTDKMKFPWKIYLVATLIVVATTLLNIIIFPYLRVSNVIMIYLLGATVVALFGKTRPLIFATILSVVSYAFFFMPPYYQYTRSEFEDFFTLIVLLSVTQVINYLSILTMRQAAAAQLTEHQTSALYTLSKKLSSTRGIDKLLNAGVTYISDIFESEVLALMPRNGELVVRDKRHSNQVLDEKELGVAQWVYELGQMAGLGTDSLSFSKALYLPLLGSHGSIGVLRILPLRPERLVSPDQMHLLEACASQIALALEVDRLQEKAKRSELKVEMDRARSSLLESVSHDLRTPLVAIVGAASTQIEMAKELDARSIKKLANIIYSEAEQVTRLISNLLQITYLDAENVKLEKEMLSIKDLIIQVLNTSSIKLEKRDVVVNTPDALPLIPFDNTLMQEVVSNLLDNAVKFTPEEAPIDILVENLGDFIMVSIRDHGPGIVQDEVNQLFEKFYRGRLLTEERGLGLGLAICRSIITAHGGDIWAENAKDGGAIFRFTLPWNNK